MGSISSSKSHPSSQDTEVVNLVSPVSRGPSKTPALAGKNQAEVHVLSYPDLHLCLCILTTPFHAVSCRMKSLCLQCIGHSLIHSSSQWESLLWLFAFICFIYCFDKNPMCSQSGYPIMPCELGEGRDHQPVPYSHPSLLPKAPSHDNIYPWETSLTHQYSRQRVSSLRYTGVDVGFRFYTTRKSSMADR